MCMYLLTLVTNVNLEENSAGSDQTDPTIILLRFFFFTFLLKGNKYKAQSNYFSVSSILTVYI